MNVNGKLYVGSTEDKDKRISKHDSEIIHSNTKLYVAIRANDNEYIFTVHHYTDAIGVELRKEEQSLMDELQPELNEIRAYNSDEYNKEYNAKRDALHSEEKAKYYQDHKEEISDYNKKYYEKWRVDNPEKYIALLERKNEKITCDCGSIISKSHYSAHCITQKHINGQLLLADTSS